MVPEINEDVMGLLRSASGKARLLVSQKMKQFEGELMMMMMILEDSPCHMMILIHCLVVCLFENRFMR